MTEHISDQEFTNYWNHTLSADGTMRILEHIGHCNFCAARLTSSMPKEMELVPNPYVRRGIMAEAKKFDRRRMLLLKTEFLRYCMRVSLAMGCALFFLFAPNILGFGISVAVQTHKIEQISSYIWDSAIEINGKFNEILYHNVIESEELNHEKSEK